MIIFSLDSEWLVHGCQDVFIHRLKDKKRLFTLRIGNAITALALAADKSWLAVADAKGSLLLYDIQTQQLVYRLRNLPIIIRDLDITLDAQYLVAKSNKEGALIFRVWREASGVRIKLVHNSITLNLACARIKIENTQGLSADNLQLLQQNNAIGQPAPLNHPTMNLNVANPEGVGQNIHAAAPILPREISFKTAVVERGLVMSYLNPRAILDYSLWQVGLVRDAKSNDNNQHVFIIVEGMNAFGRCFFWRFDLATKIRKEKVAEGFAKVVIEELPNLLVSVRGPTLEDFLNPHELEGRGTSSLVGEVWQLKREVVLQLYREVLKDKAAGLLPYAQGGNLSFFSRARGDNCYSWARRLLLALKQDKIEKKLPSSFMDFIAIVPS
ncbi:MAG: WD40 repeat domain-containing protein, partial [Gammaproteobacteria bacterium]